MKSRNIFNTSLAQFIFAASLCSAFPASAATYTWQTAGTTDGWSTAGADTNWFIAPGNTLSPWVNANDAVFSGATGEIVTLTGALAPTSITVGAGNGNWTLSGTGGITTGSLTKTATGTLTINNTSGQNTYAGGTVISAGTVQWTVAAALGTGTIVLNDSNTGSANVSLLGNAAAGTTLTQNITVPNLGSGIVTIGGSQGAGGFAIGYSGVITLNRAVTLTAPTGSDRTTYTNNITGNVGTLTIAGGSRTSFETTSKTFTGDVAITGSGTNLQIGVVSVGTINQIPNTASVTVGTGASLRLSAGGEEFGGLNGSGTVNSNAAPAGGVFILGSQNLSGSFSGAIGSGGVTLGITKIGTGTQTLSGTGTYTGITSVNGGTLTLGFGVVSSNILGSTSALTLGGGTLNLTGMGTQTVAGLTTTANTGSGITLSTSETLTLGALTSAGANSALSVNTTAGGANGAAVGSGLVVLTGQTPGNVINSGFTVKDAGGFGLATVDVSSQIIRLTANTLLTATGATSGTDYQINNNAGGTAAAGSSSLNVTASEAAKSITVDTGTAAGTLTLSAPVTLSNNVWNFGGAGANAYTVTGGAGLSSVALDGTISFNNFNSGTVTLASPIVANGTNAVNFTGTGSTVLTGANTYTGATAIGSGTLQISGSGSLNGGTYAGNITNSGILRYSSSTAQILSGVISGSGSLFNDGVGDVTLSGPNTYTGGTTVTQGTLALGTNNGAGTGTITLGDASTGASNLSLLWTPTASTLTVTNPVTVSALGSGTVTIGTATTAFTNESFTGALTLNRATTLTSGTLNDRTNFNGPISGTVGTLTIASTNTNARVVFNGASANTFTGALLVDATGRLQLGVVSAARNYIPDASNVTVDGTMNLSYLLGDTETINSLNGSGAVGINNLGVLNILAVGSANGSGDFSGVISGGANLALTKLGTGTQTLSGVASNTYSGLTTVPSGTLLLNKNDGFIAVGGNLLINGTGIVATTAAKSNPLATTSNVTVDGASAQLQLAGNTSTTCSTLAINNGGTVVISAISNNSNIRPNGGITSTGGGSITGTSTQLGLNFNAGTRTVTVADSTLTIGLGISSGALTKAGAGTLVLNGVNNYTGATTINAGTVALGATGSLTTTTPLTIATSAKLDTTAKTSFALPATVTLDVGPAGVSGQIDATGKELDISAANVTVTGTPTSAVYVLATYATKVGAAFASFTPPVGYSINYGATQITLVQTAGGFTSWINTNYPALSDKTPNGDPDKDGIANLTEFILNGNPSISDTATLPTLNTSGSTFVFNFSRLDESLGNTTLTFQYGSTLTGWTDVVVPASGAPVVVGAATITITGGTPTDGVSVSIPKTEAGATGKLFGRLQITQP